MSKKIMVTGGCGFIGSHIVDLLIRKGMSITVIDDFSTKTDLRYLEKYIDEGKVQHYPISVQNYDDLSSIKADYDCIFHLAAQPDVKYSVSNPRSDFESNTLGTFNILEYMRMNDIDNLVFASSVGTVYGEPEVHPTPEHYPLKPISNYGAAKAAAEMYCSSYSSLYGFNISSLRLGNIYGPRSTHGVIYDFYFKLKKNPKEMEILGDGSQTKTYLYIEDTINAFDKVYNNMQKGFDVFNVGSKELTSVIEIAKILVETLRLSDVNFTFTGGKRGWKGDVTFTSVDISKLKSLGWEVNHTMRMGIEKYVKWLNQL
ncbi:NAD-dependent epimerase/dehydratase family protein [Candidatus Heimdallarchaeota archaeon]|nr:MAG: NAD-dependent epimerase/dehydratase family protein [Candidatus Heimdallarchaeota archaeon]